MKHLAYALVVLATVASAGCVTQGSPMSRAPQGWTPQLASLGITGDVDTLAEPRGYQVHQVAGTIPFPEGMPNPQIPPYSNGVMLADLKGPGAVLRLWTGAPTGTVALYIDDLAHPCIIAPMEQLFNDYRELFTQPLVGRDGDAAYSYVPLPFKDACRLVYYPDPAGHDLSYEVTYAAFPADTPVVSYTNPLTSDDEAYLRRWRTAWNEAGAVRLHDPKQEELHQTARQIWPEKDSQILPMDGPGLITEIEMFMDSTDPDMLNKVWLNIYWDGATEPAVNAPVGLFFGGEANHAGLAVGREGTRMWIRYPMPFKQKAEIRLVNMSKQKLDFSYNLTWKKVPVDGLLYFHATAADMSAEAGKPVVVANIADRGQLVGANVSVSGPNSATALAGRGMLYIDGASTPDWMSFDTASCFNGSSSLVPFDSASAGLAAEEQSGADAALAGYRSLITDVVPFDHALLLAFQHGTHNDLAGTQYRTTVLWYGEKP